MTDPLDRALISSGPQAMTALSRLAERTLADRSRPDTSTVAGRTLVVGHGGIATIRDAVELAAAGDTVLVQSGTYEESVVVTENITLKAEVGKGRVVIASPAAPGIVLEHTSATISGVAVLGGHPGTGGGLGPSAIVVRGGSPMIEGCEIRDALGHGIEVVDGASPRIYGNELSGNIGHGICVSGPQAAAVLRSNTVRDGRGGGILVNQGAAGTIEDNDIFDNVGNGIDVLSAETNPHVRSNRIRGSQGNGIAIAHGAGGLVENNEISRNGKAGVLVGGTGTAPSIQGNRITDNGTYGVFLPDLRLWGPAGGQVEGNTITGNGAGAIWAALGSPARIGSNTTN